MTRGTEPSVLWREGMFLCPQHLQTHTRQMEARTHAGATLGRVGGYGIVSIEIDEESLERDVFRVIRAELLFEDGTLARIPDDATIEQREFAGAFSGPELDVHLGIPARQPGVAELGERGDSRARYHAEVRGVHDENQKDEPREIEVRILHARLFFGDEDRSGFESIPLARLVRRGRPVAVSALSDAFVPPVVVCGGSAVLVRRLRELADSVRAQSRDLAARIPNTTGLSSVEKGADIAGFVKLQAVNQCVASLEQIARLPELHPFEAWLTLVQAVGNLAIFGQERVVPSLPVYAHDELDRCFGELIACVQSLIPAEVTVPYDAVPFREDPLRQGFHLCEVPADWLSRNPLMFLGVELAKSAEESASLVDTGVKLLAESDLERVLQGVVPGVHLEHVRTPPLAFPKRPDLHFFRIDTEGTSRDPWLKIVEAGTAVILTALGGLGARFHLYVELRSPSGTGTARTKGS
ncbi:MAG: type VI secretion system baseplate subunit TssK [Planctomycetes bacterium]|nr:type VI secretion system baseplate subunit TssK [Planctomycetota bacterium]